MTTKELQFEIPTSLACPEDDIFSFPTREDIVNALNSIADIPSQIAVKMAEIGEDLDKDTEKQLQKIIDDITELIEGIGDILSPYWEKGTVRDWRKEANDAIQELIQEFHIFVPTKVAELIAKITPISLTVNLLGIKIDILKILTKEEQQRVRQQIIEKGDEVFALLPDSFKGFDGEFGVKCDEWKAKVSWQYIKTKIQEYLTKNILAAADELIGIFKKIWKALKLPSPPTPPLTDIDVNELIRQAVESLTKKRKELLEDFKKSKDFDVRAKISEEIEDLNEKILEKLESLSIGPFNILDIIGGKIETSVVSLEQKISEISLALEEFLANFEKKLVFDWVKIVKKFLDAIGLGKIFEFVFFTFCDLLKLIGMPFNLNINIPTVAGVIGAVKVLDKKESLRPPNLGAIDRSVSFTTADGSVTEFDLPADSSGTRKVFIDGKEDELIMEDGGNLLLETTENVNAIGELADTILLESTQGATIVGNKIVFDTPPTNGQTISIVNV